MAADALAGRAHAVPAVPRRSPLPRLFPAAFLRRVVVERLGITPDEMEGGHLPALAHPVELATRLDGYWTGAAKS